MESFADLFGGEPAAVAEAPGRVNLLGEHTDYNEGYVLPTATPQKTRVAIKKSAGTVFNVYSTVLRRRTQFTFTSPPADRFATYLYGCIREMHDAGHEVPPLDIYVASDVPVGVGLSSSAALTVAALRALCVLFNQPVDEVQVAKMAQQAEIKYAGVNCGIMDQMASSLADAHSMLFLDIRTLERRLLPLPAGAELLVVDSGVTRTLAGSRYNERRAECEKAAQLLGVRALRDVDNAATVESLPEPLRRRARHVVTENQRVRDALGDRTAEEFGELMHLSHSSLRDDYEVSIPELDLLVRLLQQEGAIYGAKLTGAGFGGATVALCHTGEAVDAATRVLLAYNQAGRNGRVWIPPPESGVSPGAKANR